MMVLCLSPIRCFWGLDIPSSLVSCLGDDQVFQKIKMSLGPEETLPGGGGRGGGGGGGLDVWRDSCLPGGEQGDGSGENKSRAEDSWAAAEGASPLSFGPGPFVLQELPHGGAAPSLSSAV